MELCRGVHNAQTAKPIPIGLCANLSVSKSVSLSASRCLGVPTNRKRKIKQECIPVGCVPPAAVVVCWGGSASVHAGIPPRVWAWRPPPPHVFLKTPLGVGLENPPGQTPQLPPWVWAWRPAMHAGIPPPPVDRQTPVKT